MLPDAFLSRMRRMLGGEFDAFLASYELPRNVGIRLNPRKQTAPLAWAILSGGFGLLFGALCGITDIFIGGFAYAAVKWTSGILFDVAHCAGNFFIALLLFVPARNLLEKFYARMRR